VKQKFANFFLLLSALSFSLTTNATHIVGGEIYYTCLGGDTYEITLKVYRDCFNGQVGFDSPAYIFVYDANGVELQQLSLFPPPSDTLPLILNDPCLTAPPDLCVEEVIYVANAQFPPIPGGYYLMYQRCCRNNSILNLSIPGDVGASYVAQIPDTSLAVCNSSPRYNNFPPIVICVNETFEFDHSATDPDGDLLVYQICFANEGAGTGNPQPPNNGSPFPTPPNMSSVPYGAGYSSAYPIDAAPPLVIDPVTGLLTMTPTTIGQYVVAICVEEWRNGQLLSVNKRDFQFNVAQCLNNVVAATPNVIKECDDFVVFFQNNSVGAVTAFWNFGTGDPADTSIQYAPTFTFIDTGIYTVMLIVNEGFSCADTAYAEVWVYPFIYPNYNFTAGCADDPVFFTDSSTTPNGNIIQWIWDFGDNSSAALENPSHDYATGGIYNVTLYIESDKGCIDSITQIVQVDYEPVAYFNPDTLCEDNFTQLFDSSTIASGDVISWLWDFDDGQTSSIQDPQHLFGNFGSFDVMLTVTSDSGCVDSFSAVVVIGQNAAVDAGTTITINYGETTEFNGSTNGISYEWLPHDSLNDPFILNPVANPTVTTTYTLFVENADGCVANDTVTVIVLYPNAIDVPNAFSPNGDGHNDFLFVRGYNVSSLIFKVFDRWGHLVFETTDIEIGWDGTLKGKEKEMEVYVWYLDAVLIDQTTVSKKGNVTLVR